MTWLMSRLWGLQRERSRESEYTHERLSGLVTTKIPGCPITKNQRKQLWRSWRCSSLSIYLVGGSCLKILQTLMILSLAVSSCWLLINLWLLKIFSISFFWNVSCLNTWFICQSVNISGWLYLHCQKVHFSQGKKVPHRNCSFRINISKRST